MLILMATSPPEIRPRLLAGTPLLLIALGVVATVAVLTGFQYRHDAASLTAQWESRDDELARIFESTIPPLLHQDYFPALRQSLQHSLAGDPFRRVSVLTADGVVVADSAQREVGAALHSTLGSRWHTIRDSGRRLTWIEQEPRSRVRHTLVALHAESADPTHLPIFVGAVLLRSDLAGLTAAKRAALAYVLKINWLSTCIFLLLLWLSARTGLLALRPSLPLEKPSDTAVEVDPDGSLITSELAPGQPTNRFYLAAWNSLSAHTAVLRKDGTIVAVNEAWTRYGRENGNPLQFDTGVGANYLDVCRRATGPCAEEARKVLVGLQAVLDGSLKEFTLVYGCDQPAPRQRFMLSASPLPGGFGGAVVTHMDITETARPDDGPPVPVAYDRLFTTLPVGLIYLSPNLTVQQINQQAADLYQIPVASSIGLRLPDLLPPERWSRLHPLLEHVLETGQPFQWLEEPIPDAHKTDSIRHVRSEFYPDRGHDKAIRGLYVVTLDITLDKQRQLALEDRNRELDQMAIRDPLTGLYNRRFFDEALDQEWRRFQRSGEAFTVVIMDVDRFKEVNDKHGHDAGDRALQQVGTTLRQTLRESDTIARVGGDEFAALLPGTAGEHSEPALEKLRQVLKHVRVQGSTEGAIQVTLSVGAASLPGIPPVTSAAELLRVADKRMYEAKRLVSSRKSHAR